MRLLHHHIVIVFLTGLIGWSCADQPAEPEGPVNVDVQLSGDRKAPPEISRFLGRFPFMTTDASDPLFSIPSGEASTAAIDEAQIVVLDFTRWESDAQALSAVDREPDSLYDAARFDIRKDIWDNLTVAFKAYRGSSYRFSGQYPLAIRNGVARGIIGAPPGVNLFFAALRSKRRTIYLYSAIVLVVPGRRDPITLFETTAEGSELNNIALWTGDAWVPVAGGFNGPVISLATDGVNLFAGGKFSTAGTAQAANIAMFNGTAWRGLGDGVNDTVLALAANGAMLYAGGAFTRAGNAPAAGIAAWNGSGWSSLGTGMNGAVHAIALDTASLVAGGEFTTAGGVPAENISRWNGSTWTPLSSGTNGTVHSITIIPGNGAVVAGGDFSRAAGQLVNGIAAYTGTTWSGLGTGLGLLSRSVRSVLLFGPDLFAAGTFNNAGGVSADNVAIWRSNAWIAAGNGLAGGGAVSIGSASPVVHSLAHDGTFLVAGGSFSRSGLLPASNVAVWTGSSWLPLKDGLDGPVHAVIFHRGALIAGGEFRFSR